MGVGAYMIHYVHRLGGSIIDIVVV